MKGNTPNELLDLKSSKQNKMSYNEGQYPVQIPETKNSLLQNQRYSRNTKIDEENNYNSNNKYDEYGMEKKDNDNNNNDLIGSMGMNENI